MTLKDVLKVTESSQKIMIIKYGLELMTTKKELSKKEALKCSKVEAIETTNKGGTTYLVIGLK